MSLTHKEKLLSQSELLSSLLDFISQDDRNVILNWDKRLRSDWVEQSYRLNEKDFVLFDAKRQYKLLKNISWIKTLDKIKELSYVPYYPQNDQKVISNIPGKKKKQHELSRLRGFFEQYCQKKIVDFGGGVGNSAKFLKDNFDISSVVVENNPKLIQAGKKKWSDQISYIEGYVDDQFILPKDQYDTALGLHTCGNFAPDMIRASHKANIGAVLNFGCCYSKIENDHYHLSEINDKKFKLNKRALASATLSFSETDSEIFKFRQRIMDYKYSFYHLLSKQIENFEFVAMSNSRRHLFDIKFEDFYQLTMDKYFPNVKKIPTRNVSLFYRSQENKDLIHYFKHYYALSRYIGELAEAYILNDRVCFGEKLGYKASLYQFFDPKISPRSKGIILIK